VEKKIGKEERRTRKGESMGYILKAAEPVQRHAYQVSAKPRHARGSTTILMLYSLYYTCFICKRVYQA
jgi:hypothetical protein